jgi:hypothetical protein
MKRLSVISLTLLSLLAALLVGCGGSHDVRIMAELDRADSLLLTADTAAHSAALRQMLALDTARALQADEALRARHALLLTQAQFKSYLFPSNDSLINIARNYFANHHSSAQDHELYTRSLIYSGAVAQMTDNPQQAMQWYLEAESTADPNDHFNLGYTNLRIAELYEGEFVTDSTDIVRLKQALPHFVKAGSDYYRAVCLTGIGGLYRTHNNDSALHYLQQAISFSKEHGLTYNYYEALDKLCGLYYYLEDYSKSKDLATKIYRENQGVYDDTKYISLGIRSFAKLGMIDSAEYYLKLMPPPQNVVDSMTQLDMLAEISCAKHDYQNYSVYAMKCASMADSVMLNSYQVQLKDTEEKYNNTLLKLNNSRLKFNLLLLFTILLILVLLLLLLLQRYRNIKRQIKQANSEKDSIQSEMQRLALEQELAKVRLEQLETEKGQLASDNERLEIEKEEREHALAQASLMANKNKGDVNTPELLACHYALLRELSEKLQCDDRNVSFLTAIFTSRKRYNLTIGKLSKEFWANLEYVVNTGYQGIITHVKQNCPKCSEVDARFIALSCLGFSNEVIKLCLDFTNIKTISSYKTYTMKKLTGKNQNIDDFIKEFLHSKA